MVVINFNNSQKEILIGALESYQKDLKEINSQYLYLSLYNENLGSDGEFDLIEYQGVLNREIECISKLLLNPNILYQSLDIDTLSIIKTIIFKKYTRNNPTQSWAILKKFFICDNILKDVNRHEPNLKVFPISKLFPLYLN